MKTLVGGGVAAILGLVGLAVWFGDFLEILAGTVPIILLVGGGLAIYLGFDEVKDVLKKGGSSPCSASDELAKANDEISALKKELEELKAK
ncbi:MAG: hypothetical protein CSB33_04250 [Desulfobacterales bacterium]|nr:MAG: hypothetical protein CSB33_04250 [Desulfobacterales bacterium]